MIYWGDFTFVNQIYIILSSGLIFLFPLQSFTGGVFPRSCHNKVLHLPTNEQKKRSQKGEILKNSGSGAVFFLLQG
jgi:hypothetical protein